MKRTLKKSISFIMTLCFTAACFAGWDISAFAADSVSVKIVSFVRGEQTNLRSSELLEARVEGYDGNERELTYEWTNELGTYLYVYNNHNMYGIDGTDGEIEIYNDEVSSSANMAGRSYDTTFAGKGFAWAAIYGANYSNSDLLGTITVTVKDEKGNVIATDSHTGTRSGRWGRYVYSGFVADSLESDMKAISFGIFEGDSKHIRELFSESSIVHITCGAAAVSEAKITEGEDYISLEPGEEEGHYVLTALSAGTSEITMTLEKENCKFHQNSSGESVTTVYIYKKPVPTPTTTTITLTNLDESCTYYIDGNQGKKQDDGTIIFEGLTPNTTYTIEAQGYTEGTEVVYAYTQATTLPVFNATVMVYLDGGYDTASATAYGTLINIDTIRETENDLFVKNINGGEFIELVNTSTGVYTAGLSNGTYYIYRDSKEASKISDQHLDIDNADRTRYLFYYSVSYDANGGSGAPAAEYYYEASQVTVSEAVPTKEGYTFTGWKDADGNIYQPGAVLTEDIEKAYKLTAQWEESIKADVNLKVVINHEGETALDPEPTGTLTVDLAYRADETEPYVEVVGKEASYNDWYTAGIKEGNVTTTAYPSIFTDLSGKYEYSANVFLDQYQVVDSDVVKTEDAEGNAVYDVTVYLQYNPDLFNLTYNVETDESVPDELIPQAADIKILVWDVNKENEWSPISRHKDYSVDVKFDSTDGRHGNGSYGVPVHNDGDTNYYRVDAAGLTLADGTEILLTTTDGVNYYSAAADGLAQGAYSAVVSVVGGKDVDNTDLDGAYGVYIEDYVQQGEITVTVYVNRYDVIFNSNGGSEIAPIEDQFTIPDVSGYVPVKDNHTFKGWYTDAALTIPVTAGTVMSSDVTLYAKWAENLTVKGTVSVAGTYETEDNSVHTIFDADRIKTVKVLIQRIDANGYPVTIDSRDVSITYTNDMGTGQYEFNDIQNDGHSYRIKAIEENYGEAYQNELSSSTVVTDYEVYDDTHYTAEFNGDITAVVNAYLPFNPVIFELNYKIDSTAIAEGFRPEGVETLVLCDDGLNGTNPQHWAVITQMIINGTAQGQDTALTAGTGEDSYPVWEGNPSKLYDYAIRVDKYTSGGAEISYNEQTAPFRIYYNGSARYSAVNGQTQLLTATLVPKMYTITFDTNAENDTVLNMENYLTVSGAYEDTYYWSYGKEITARPLRVGYKFLGWFDADGNQVTSVAADMAENITVTAKWEKADVEQYTSDYAYIFGYNDATMGAEGPLLRCEVSAMVHRLVKQNNKLGDFVYNAAAPSFADIAGEWFQSGIEYAHHEGAFTAPEGGNVQPYVQITRGEAFKIVALGLEFTEETDLSNQEYTNLLYELGYIVGDDNGNLNSDSNITRAEFCTLYNRIISRSTALLVDRNEKEITAETYGFTDLSGDEWYYEDMVRATSAYDDSGYVDVSLRGIRNDLDDYNG